ncbi:recombinase RecT [Flavobacterium sp. CBA20B-1]|uniref:recombinase RecT n=1 Tax=unclassified Flavobacterium TaxID=196869 RepID=UPI002225A70E|nr:MULTISPECIES: RecT family recombinase [unclassified Flavobacterium]WCM42445.1 recombinase RecT [Flavobacterium sp. CBA20B-1]
MNTQNPNPNPNTQVSEVKKDISTQVLAKVESFQKSGELVLPKDYIVENALKSAYIILSDPKNNLIEKCDKASVAEALLKMVVYGVSPIKKQCYFIPYGQKLECSISYAGNIAIAKRYGNLKSIKGNAIFEGDVLEFEVDAMSGRRKIIKHTQSLDSIGSTILKGAYAVYELKDGTVDVEIMNIKQIQAAWGQGGSKGNSPAHKNFPDQMAVKTVINRACKLLISSSDDSILYDPLEENDYVDTEKGKVQHEINQNANNETIGFENYEEAEIVEENHQEIIDNHNEVVEQEAPQTVMDGPGF